MIRRENRSTKMSRNDIKTCEYSPNQDFSPSVNQPSMLKSKPYKDHNLNLKYVFLNKFCKLFQNDKL